MIVSLHGKCKICETTCFSFCTTKHISVKKTEYLLSVKFVPIPCINKTFFVVFWQFFNGNYSVYKMGHKKRYLYCIKIFFVIPLSKFKRGFSPTADGRSICSASQSYMTGW